MKLGLLLPTNIYFCPYVKIYTDVLDKNNIQYDIIYPDKRGLKEEAAYRYTRKIDDKSNKIAKLLYYWDYSRFLRKTIKANCLWSSSSNLLKVILKEALQE